MKLLRLVSHEQQDVRTHVGRGDFGTTDVSYVDKVFVVNADCFIYAELYPAQTRYKSSRDIAAVNFWSGHSGTTVHMWPEEFKEKFGFDIYTDTSSYQ